MKTLILYYSKSGHTRDLAAAIHKVIGGDMSELKSQRKYSSSLWHDDPAGRPG